MEAVFVRHASALHMRTSMFNCENLLGVLVLSSSKAYRPDISAEFSIIGLILVQL